MALDFFGDGSGGTELATASRNKQHQTVKFADTVFSASQARGSVLIPATKKVELKGSKQLFNIVQPVDYDERLGGVRQTQFKKQVTSRREMSMRQWDTSVAVDQIDDYTSDLDLKMAYKSELMNAQGRLIDWVILNGLITPAVSEAPSNVVERSATSRNSLAKDLGDVMGKGQLFYAATSVVESRYNLYGKFAKGTGVDSAVISTTATKLDAFDVDDLTDILHVFRTRNVYEEPVATLTPELERTLYKQADFKNSERVFKIGGTLESLSGAISYRGIKFIRVNNPILPAIDFENIAYGRASLTGARHLVVRDLDRPSIIIPPSLLARVNTAPTSVLGAAVMKKGAASITVAHSELTSLKNSAVYFWIPKALYCSTSGPAIMAEGNLQAYREAPYIYNSIPVASMLIQEDHSMVFLIDSFTCSGIRAGLGTTTLDNSGQIG